MARQFREAALLERKPGLLAARRSVSTARHMKNRRAGCSRCFINYNPPDKVLHVGRTPRGKKGLRQRLNNHLHAGSSFTLKYLDGHGARLRDRRAPPHGRRAAAPVTGHPDGVGVRTLDGVDRAENLILRTDRCGRYLVGRVGPTRRGKRAHSVKRSGESVAAELSLSRRMDT
jgi:hypothetical protein